MPQAELQAELGSEWQQGQKGSDCPLRQIREQAAASCLKNKDDARGRAPRPSWLMSFSALSHSPSPLTLLQPWHQSLQAPPSAEAPVGQPFCCLPQGPAQHQEGGENNAVPGPRSRSPELRCNCDECSYHHAGNLRIIFLVVSSFFVSYFFIYLFL